VDALFLTQEATAELMHIGLMMFYSPSEEMNGPVQFKDILNTFKARAHLATVFQSQGGQVAAGY